MFPNVLGFLNTLKRQVLYKVYLVNSCSQDLRVKKVDKLDKNNILITKHM